jgi:hypothetical protein
MAEERDEQATAVTETEASGDEARADELHTTDAAERAGEAPTPPPPQAEPSGGATSPAEADRIAADEQDAFAAKPHVYALGAFAGAFAFAQILKRIFGDDDD